MAKRESFPVHKFLVGSQCPLVAVVMAWGYFGGRRDQLTNTVAISFTLTLLRITLHGKHPFYGNLFTEAN